MNMYEAGSVGNRKSNLDYISVKSYSFQPTCRNSGTTTLDSIPFSSISFNADSWLTTRFKVCSNDSVNLLLPNGKRICPNVQELCWPGNPKEPLNETRPHHSADPRSASGMKEIGKSRRGWNGTALSRRPSTGALLRTEARLFVEHVFDEVPHFLFCEECAEPGHDVYAAVEDGEPRLGGAVRP